MVLPLYYNWRNLLARKLSTALTFVVVSVVVFVLTLLLSFAAGIRASLVASGSPLNLIVLKPGATAESTSLIRPEEIARLVQTPGVARQNADADGVPAGTLLVSPELCVQTPLRRFGPTGSVANVAVRGVDPVAFAVHAEVRISAGRCFRPAALEAIVGKSAQARFTGLQVGHEVFLGRKGDRSYRIVGVFDAAGGALESEIWTPRTMLADSLQRSFSSSVCLRLSAAGAADDAIRYINGPTVQLSARRETVYYDDLASKTREIVVLTTVLVSIMAAGAVFAVANTMYATVDHRQREIAMLRTLGFGRAAIVLAILMEALLVCTTACVVGLAASLLFNGSRQDYLSDATWTVLAYELRVTPQIVLAALATATLVGAVGAIAPGVRAARLNVLAAMRKG